MDTEDVDGIPDMGRVWSLDVNELNIETKPFARGAFGKVYKGEYFGTAVCIKAIKKEDPNDRDYFKFIQREVTMLKFGHPNLVQFMGVVEKDDEILIVTEYISGGHLRQYLKDNRVHIPWALRVQIATDVACGMAYLHSKGIIHRDLKSKNLLVGDNWRVKVCDFGFARSINTTRRQLMTVCGTGEWMAPEVLLGMDYDEKADVYSFGIVMCELITRRKVAEDLPRSPEHYSLDMDKFIVYVPGDCPSLFLQTAMSCCDYDPNKRPSFKDVTKTLKTLLNSLKPSSNSKGLVQMSPAPPAPPPSNRLAPVLASAYNSGAASPRIPSMRPASPAPTSLHSPATRHRVRWSQDEVISDDERPKLEHAHVPPGVIVWSNTWDPNPGQVSHTYSPNIISPLCVSPRLNTKTRKGALNMITPSGAHRNNQGSSSSENATKSSVAVGAASASRPNNPSSSPNPSPTLSPNLSTNTTSNEKISKSADVTESKNGNGSNDNSSGKVEPLSLAWFMTRNKYIPRPPPSTQQEIPRATSPLGFLHSSHGSSNMALRQILSPPVL